MISIKVDEEIRDFLSETRKKNPLAVTSEIPSSGSKIFLAEDGEWRFGFDRCITFLLFFRNSKAQDEFEAWLKKNRPEDLL